MQGRWKRLMVPHLCSTESGSPSKGKSYTGLGKKSRLMKTVQTMKGHGNYQNCPVMRPHTPHSSYGTYVTLAPKVLVFPVFVQVSWWLASREVRSKRVLPPRTQVGGEKEEGPSPQDSGMVPRSRIGNLL